MSKMTQQKWNSMSGSEKQGHLKSGKLEVERQMGFPADAKVNDNNAEIVSRYRVKLNGIVMSHWHASEDEAIKEYKFNFKELGD